MPNRTESAERLLARGCIAVVRADSSEQLMGVGKALLAGGVDCIEITMTTPNALAVIEQSRAEFGDDAFVGVGSVMNADVARDALAAGAQFVVSPIFDPATLEAAHAADAPCVPGCLTPNEIIAATNAGADAVKVFPANHFGPKYFKDLLAPMPHLKLTPTGGVDLDTAADFIKAGAVTLGVGSALVKKDAIRAGDFDALEGLARQFVAIVAQARAEMG